MIFPNKHWVQRGARSSFFFNLWGGGSRHPDSGPWAAEDAELNDGRPAVRRLPGQTCDGKPRRRLPGWDRLGGWRRVDPSPVRPLPPLLTVLGAAARWAGLLVCCPFWSLGSLFNGVSLFHLCSDNERLLADYGASFVAAWKNTHNHRVWFSNKHPAMTAITPG